MPLSPPASRQPVHRRQIVLEGFVRDDGLFDVEGRLSDTKTYDFVNHDRGVIAAGEKLHGMTMRMTIDDTMLITACEAQTDYGPFLACPAAAANFVRLAGLRVRPGFVRAAAERIGGEHGCTHLRELLAQMATVAFQTIYPVLAKRPQPSAENSPALRKPGLIGTCYAYRSDGPVVQRQWPHYYTGSGEAEPSEPEVRPP